MNFRDLIGKVFRLSGLPSWYVFKRKLFIICYAGIINFVIVVIASKYIKDHISKEYDGDLNGFDNFLNMSATITCILIVYYIVRKIMEMLTYPFHNPPKFDVYRVKEIKTTIITSFGYLMYLHKDIVSYRKLFDKYLPSL